MLKPRRKGMVHGYRMEAVHGCMGVRRHAGKHETSLQHICITSKAPSSGVRIRNVQRPVHQAEGFGQASFQSQMQVASTLPTCPCSKAHCCAYLKHESII